MWSADGKTLYFMSDRSGAQNIWSATLPRAGERRRGQGAAPASGTAACCGRRFRRTARPIAFERDFGIWTVDTASGQAREVPIALRGAPAAAGGRAPHVHRSDSGAGAVARRQEGRVHRARRGLRGVGEGRRRRRARHRHRRRGGRARLGARQPPARVRARTATARTICSSTTSPPASETPLTTGARRDNHAARSRRTGSGLRSSATHASCASSTRRRRKRTLVATGVFGTPPFFDAARLRLVARLAIPRLPHRRREDVFDNVIVAPVGYRRADEGRRGRPVSFLANTSAGALSWSPDGTYLTFTHRPAHRVRATSCAST